MIQRILSTSLFVAVASLAAPSYAADIELKAGLITESRTFEQERVSSRGSQQGVFRVSINRVTVALDGELITGQWTPGPFLRDLRTTSRERAENFPVGTNVLAATRSNQLLLAHPDGGVVRARIVDRAPATEPEPARD